MSDVSSNGEPIKPKKSGVTIHQDAKGRFLPGNKANPGGNSHERYIARKHYNIFRSAVTDEDTIAITKKLIKMAKRGNLRAIEIYYDRMLGKPKQEIDLGIQTDTLNINDLSTEELIEIAKPKLLAMKQNEEDLK